MESERVSRDIAQREKEREREGERENTERDTGNENANQSNIGDQGLLRGSMPQTPYIGCRKSCATSCRTPQH